MAVVVVDKVMAAMVFVAISVVIQIMKIFSQKDCDTLKVSAN
jgi:hypothetical protein